MISISTGCNRDLLVDKPQGWTSHDVVARTRRLAGTRKVGHAGTLDPMATGLLILGINSSTRLLTYVVGLDKEYLATIRLGASTTTDDAEGETSRRREPGASQRSKRMRRAGIAELTGDIEQVPSSVSAIKVDGKRAYARVRAGEEVELPPRPVTVSEFELLASAVVDGSLDLEVRVVCSSAPTFVLSPATSARARRRWSPHRLRRTRIGPFDVGRPDARGTRRRAALIRPGGCGRPACSRASTSPSAGHRPRARQTDRLTGDPDDAARGRSPVAAVAPDAPGSSGAGRIPRTRWRQQHTVDSPAATPAIAQDAAP